jgi:DNA-binding MarR family transcriptional regulator
MQGNMMRKWAQHERPGYLINRAARLMLRLADIRFRPLGLGVASFPVLSMLRTGQKLSQKELALCARIEQPSMAQLLSRLERDGMIKRSPDPGDGRSSLISITRKAQGILPEVDAAVDAGNELALGGMSDDEVKTLIDLLQRLIGNLERATEREQAGTDRAEELRRRRSPPLYTPWRMCSRHCERSEAIHLSTRG